MTPNVQAVLSTWAAQPDLQPPPLVREHAALAVLDGLGVALAARRHPDGDTVLQLVRMSTPAEIGPPSIVGERDLLNPRDSALANAFRMHLLDFDDSNGDLAGHATTVVLPAVLAACRDIRASGRSMIEAYCTGVEVAAALGRLANPRHYDAGWHPTSTLGIFGAAAGTGRVLGLGAGQIATALGLSTGLAAGLKSSFGTLAKPLQVAYASAAGVTAAYLAQLGADAPRDAFEHVQGFLKVFDNVEVCGADALHLPSGDAPDWSLANPGMIIKQYPCCGSTHAAAEAARLLHQRGITATDIANVEIRLHPKRLTHVNRPAPKTPLEGKFSVQYVVARMLMSGAVTIDDFDRGRVCDAQARDLMSRTSADVLPDAADHNVADRYGAAVTVTTTSGAEESAFVAAAPGRAPGRMLDADLVIRKFHECADPTIGATRATVLRDAVLNLNDLPDVTELLTLCLPMNSPLQASG